MNDDSADAAVRDQHRAGDELHVDLLAVLNDPIKARGRSMEITSVTVHDVALGVDLEHMRRDPSAGPLIVAMSELHLRRVVEALQALQAQPVPISH